MRLHRRRAAPAHGKEDPVSLLNEFKTFLLRGNVIDLAVAVVVGAAFKSVVDSLVADLFMPIIAMLGGEPDFSSLDFTINDAIFGYGAFITAVVSFLIVSGAIFFFVVKPMNLLLARAHREPPPDPSIKKCPECLSDVPAEARRCMYCTSQLATA
jgi:large conductance mechanosensitive channel